MCVRSDFFSLLVAFLDKRSDWKLFWGVGVANRVADRVGVANWVGVG